MGPPEATLIADRREPLDAFLRRHGYQQWRVSILLECGALFWWRKRGKEESRILNARDHTKKKPFYVQKGDMIRVNLSRCQNQFNQVPARDFWDYAFISGKGSFSEHWRKICKLRIHTEVIQDPEPPNIKEFIKEIIRNPRIEHPIRDLIIVGHASAEGDLWLDLDTLYTGQVTYHSLRRAAPVHIPPSAVTPRPKEEGRERPLGVHIKGCNIGRVEPFLQALWEWFGGGNVVVTAPKHYHRASKMKRGWVEYFEYRFLVKRPKPFETVQKMKNAFKNERFARWPFGESSTVPDSCWDDWIPKGRVRKRHLAPAPGEPEDIKVTEKVKNPIDNRLLVFQNRPVFLARVRYLYGYPPLYIEHVKPDPGTQEKREQKVREYYEKKYEGSQFPIWSEYEYPSLEEFMAGWAWEIEWKTYAGTSGLQVQATRYEYEVRQPIVNPRTNELFMNQYSRHRGLETRISITEDNDKFFGQYPLDALKKSDH